MLQLKRGDCVRVQTEMVEFFAMPFLFSSKLEIWSFQVVVLQRRQRNLQTKRDANLGTRLAGCMCRVVILRMKPIAFFLRCRRRRRRHRSFVRSLVMCNQKRIGSWLRYCLIRSRQM